MEMTDYDILDVCQLLIDQQDFRSVSQLVRMTRHIHDLCQPLLRKALEQETIYMVTNCVDQAINQLFSLRIDHHYYQPHLYLIKVNKYYLLETVLQVVAKDDYYIIQVIYDHLHPASFGWESIKFKAFTLNQLNTFNWIGERLLEGYLAVLGYNQTGMNQSYQLCQNLKKCRDRQRPCYFYYHITKTLN